MNVKTKYRCLHLKSPLKRSIIVLLSCLMAVSIYSFGDWIGESMLRIRKGYHLEWVERAHREENILFSLLTNHSSQKIAVSYIGASVDAWIKYNDLPRKQEAVVLTDLITSIPGGLEVLDLRFIEDDIIIECSADNQTTITNFLHELSCTSSIQSAGLQSLEQSDSGFKGTVLCSYY